MGWVSEKVEDAGDYVEEKVEDAVDYVEEKVEDTGDFVDEQVEDAVDFVTEDIPDFVEEEIIDPVGDFIGNVGDALGDAVEGLVETVDEAIQNPYIRAVASFVYPPAAPYLNAYAKLDSGESLTAGDLASLGISAVSDLSSVTIDPSVAKAVETGARIADGENAVETLAGVYGADFAKELGLDTKLKSNLESTFGVDAANFVSEYVDVNQAAADLVAGKSIEDITKAQLGDDVLTFAGNKALEGVGQTFGSDTQDWLSSRMDINQAAQDIIAGKDASRIIANQFGDEIAEYIGADDPDLKALGYAGIETAVALDQGEEASDALLAGGKEYYDRGGKLPDIGQLAGTVGLQDYNFDWNKFLPNISIETPELFAQGYDWLKGTGIDINNWIEGRDWGELNLNVDQFADLGGNFNMPNWEGVDIREFGGLDVPEGVDWRDLKYGDLGLPQFLLVAGAEEEQRKAKQAEYIDPFADTTQEEDTVAEATPLSQVLLKSTPLV